MLNQSPDVCVNKIGAGADERPRFWRIGALVVFVLLLHAKGLTTLVPEARAHDMPPEAEAACDAEGGCVLVSRAAVQQLVEHAYRMGQATCESRI